MVACLQATTFKGFRSYQEVPTQGRVKALLRGYRLDPIFWGFMLRGWLELTPELSEEVTRLAGEQGLGETCDCVPHGVRSEWEEDQLSALADQLLARTAAFGLAEARLALQMMCTGLPMADSACDSDHAADEDAAVEDAAEAPSGTEPESVEGVQTPDLAERLDVLEARMQVVAVELRDAADLLGVGQAPPRTLLERLSALLDDHAQACALVGYRAREGDASRFATVAELRAIHVRSSELPARQAAATPVLRRALGLTTARSFAALDELRARASAWLADPAQDQDEPWVTGLCALLELSDAEVPLERLHDLETKVAEGLGRELALAAIRGLIRQACPEAALADNAPPPAAGGVASPAQAAPAKSIRLPQAPTTTLSSSALPPDPPAAGSAQDPIRTSAPVPVPLAAEPAASSPVWAAPIPPPEEEDAGPAAGIPEARSEHVAGPSAPSAKLAKAALSVSELDRGEAACRVVWALVGEGQLALAYALAVAATDYGSTPTWAMPPPVIRGLAFGRRVLSSEDPATLEVLEAITRLDLPVGQDEASRAIRIICAAMSLRPALLSRESGAMGLLQSLTIDATGNLTKVRECLAGALALGAEVGPALLKGLHEKSTFQARLASLRTDCVAWYERAQQQTLVFAGATDVWHFLLKPNSDFYALIEPAMTGNLARRSEVAKSLEALSGEKQIDRLIKQAEKEVRGRKAASNPVLARAYQSLVTHIRDGLAFAQRWLDLSGAAPEGRRDARHQRIEDWRSELNRAVGTGRIWLKKASACDLLASTASRVLTRSLDELLGLFDPQAAPETFSQSETVLGAELLRIPHLVTDDFWEPVGSKREVATRVLHAVADGLPTWYAALQIHLAEERFLSASRILELASAGLAEGLDAAAEFPNLDSARERARVALAKNLASRRLEIEQAVSLDLLNEADRLKLVGRVERVDPAEVLDFQPVKDDLRELEERLKGMQSQRAREIEVRVKEEEIARKDPDAFQRIQDALARGDLPTATEYLDGLARGEPLAAKPAIDQFTEVFFPKFVREGNSTEVNFAEAPAAIQQGRALGPIDTAGFLTAQREEAAKFVRHWQRARNKQDVVTNVAALLEGLGFRSVKLSASAVPKADGTLQLLDLTCEPIRDRDVCVIPQFGSLAQGRYRLLCAWGRPAEEELISTVGQAQGAPVISLYFGKMSEGSRRELAKLSRERRRQLLVIDEVLMLFLAVHRGSRLPVLFRCGLPFTVAEPYVTSAGLVPVEMFFGRRREQQAIMDLLGTSLVYGGRQLGKTALLREVERSNHAPKQGVIVVWADLKQAGIGRERPAHDVWEVIGGILEQHGVVKKGTTDFRKIHERVLEWLKADLSRRIVLLLDEADMFLAADRHGEKGQSYATLLELKRLLDESQKRFKFVLAGLHDVQRTSRDPNTPLAHLGTPICIGPLLGGGEALEARALIEAPLATLGYRFEHVDLPTRILSHTNYYPSLIQLFCWHLLQHVANTRIVNFESRSSPPFIITAKHVEEAYQSQQLRSAIRDRFKWTLDLDPRYKLIAMLIAWESLERREALSEGFSAKQIQELALFWWKLGFEDPSPEAFRTILDEMIGLGLLRKSSGGAYALRSANVLNLLGSKREIEEEIESTASGELPKPHEHPQLRRADPDSSWRRSPLTLTQEVRVLQRTNGACVVFGGNLANRDAVPAFLDAAIPGLKTELVEAPTRAAVEAMLTKLLDARERFAVAIIPASSPWTEAWVESAHKLLEKRQAKESVVRAVFLGDPSSAMRWGQLDPTTQQRLSTQLGIETVMLAPWTDGALRAWFEDAQFGPANSPAGRNRVREATGNWGELVHRLGEECKVKKGGWEESLASLQKSLTSEQLKPLLEVPQELEQYAKVLVEFQGSDTPNDVATIVEGLDSEKLKAALDWAVALGYVTRGETGWTADPIFTEAYRATA